MLGKARRGWMAPKFGRRRRRSSGKAKGIGGSLVAHLQRGLRGRRGKTQAVKWARLLGGIKASINA